jgi:NAD(P)-dependent dehydrogenase (short-subunit alcohol dehydrogenase family)
MDMNYHSKLITTHKHSIQNRTNYNRMVAVVTGSSSGIGLETALLLARSGFQTYATMRDLKKSKDVTEIANAENLPLTVIQLDVDYDRSVKDAISQIVTENKRIDVLVNNAGYGLFSPIEDVTLRKVKEQFETNFFGVVRVADNEKTKKRNNCKCKFCCRQSWNTCSFCVCRYQVRIGGILRIYEI